MKYGNGYAQRNELKNFLLEGSSEEDSDFYSDFENGDEEDFNI